MVEYKTLTPDDDATSPAAACEQFPLARRLA